MGQWLPLEKEVSFDPRSRQALGEREGGLQRTLPPLWGPWQYTMSAPYAKLERMAGDIWVEEQPDYVTPAEVLMEVE